jgi:hypothetical protein
MLVLALGWQPRVDPIGLAFGVIPHVRVTYCRQFPGGRFRSVSSRVCAVDHDIRVLIGQERRS